MPIIIDAPNYINSLLSHGLRSEIVAKQSSIGNLHAEIEKALSSNLARKNMFLRTEFVCSRKLFGPSENRFTAELKQVMVERYARTPGVHVEEVGIDGKEEKGVDVAIAVLMISLAEKYDWIALVSEDKDYIPALKYLRERDKRVVTVKIRREPFPPELINESYIHIDLSNKIHELFEYSPPNPIHVEQMQLEELQNFLINCPPLFKCALYITRTGYLTYTPSPKFDNETMGWWIYNKGEAREFRIEKFCDQGKVKYLLDIFKKALKEAFCGNLEEQYGIKL